MERVSESRRDRAEIEVENISRICIHLDTEDVYNAHFLALARIADRTEEESDDPNRFPLSSVREIESLNHGVMQKLEALARKKGIRFLHDAAGLYVGYADTEKCFEPTDGAKHDRAVRLRRHREGAGDGDGRVLPG